MEDWEDGGDVVMMESQFTDPQWKAAGLKDES